MPIKVGYGAPLALIEIALNLMYKDVPRPPALDRRLGVVFPRKLRPRAFKVVRLYSRPRDAQ